MNKIFTARQVPLTELTRSGLFFEKGAVSGSQSIEAPYTPSVGYHVYADLRLNNFLEAPRLKEDSQRLLEVLHLYAQAAHRAAVAADGTVLEVQGNRIHVLLPAEDPALSFGRVLTFSRALTEAVYEVVRPKAGDDFQSFATAADHGKAVLIRSISGSSESVVSLGIPANSPAKRLGTHHVPPGNLSIPKRLVPPHLLTGSGGDWIDIDVRELSSSAAQFVDHEFGAMVKAAAIAPETAPAETYLEVRAHHFEPGEAATPENPFQTFAFCLRADLNGFTKKVAAAFSIGGSAVIQLVEEFSRIMETANEFVREFRAPIIALPWAGDCATMVFPNSTVAEYRGVREHLPAQAVVEWLDKCSDWEKSSFSNGGFDTKWTLGVAGGEVHGNSHTRKYPRSKNLDRRSGFPDRGGCRHEALFRRTPGRRSIPARSRFLR